MLQTQQKRHFLNYLIASISVSFCILIITAFSKSAFGQNSTGYKIKTIVIDAGHGGKDPGAICKTGKEKDVTLSIALKLGVYINKYLKDVKVIYTRDKDEFIELYKRAEIANSNNADVFISIHVNANKKPDPNGAETYVMGLHKSQGNLDVAMAENAVILKEDNYSNQYDGFDPNSPEAFIIFSLYQNAYLDQSLILASKVQEQFRERVKRTDRGVKQAGFLVLWKTTMPSILIEVGFLSNPEEAKYLFDDQNQDYLASAIFRAFRDYKNEVEGKGKSTDLTPEKQNDDEIINEAQSKEKQQVDTITNIANEQDTTHASQDTFQQSAENLVQQLESGIFFKVQIVNSSTQIKLSPENFNGLNNVEELKLDGSYKYTVGKTSNFDEIVKIKNDLKTKYPDAFIVAFKNGKKIPVNEAIKEIKN